MDVSSECSLLYEFYGKDQLRIDESEKDIIKGLFVVSPAVSRTTLKVCKSVPINTHTLLTVVRNANDGSGEFCEYEITNLPKIYTDFEINIRESQNVGFSVHCEWLHPEKIPILESHLKSIYDEHVADSPLSYCFSFLEYESFGFLFPSFESCSAVTFNEPTQINTKIVNCIVEYNEQSLRKVEPDKMYECEVCFEDVSGRNCHRLNACGHLFCQRCIVSACENALQSGLPNGTLRCLACDVEIAHYELQRILPESTFERYESWLLAKALEQMPDVSRCPMQGCETSVILMSPHLGKCPECGFCFCAHCGRTYHGETPCTSIVIPPELSIEDIAKAFEENDEELIREFNLNYGEENLKRLLAEYDTYDYIFKNTQKCPKCFACLQRLDGCNKMTCLLCGVVFCWLCLQKLDARDPYAHFQSGPCSNRLFQPHEIDEVNN